jgi:hypothetical protein
MSYAEQQARLGPQQRKFVEAILKGMTQQDAYKKAGYRVNRGNAVRLKTKENVAKALAAAKAEAAAKTVNTTASIVAELEQARILALQDGMYGPAVAASLGKAKLLGLIIDRAQVDVLHRPAPIPTDVLELSEDQWRRQFTALPPGEIRKAATDAGMEKEDIPDFMR